MSHLHQMQLSYVAEEDRILLRMNTRNRQEFRFWMTRRYVTLLWKTITQVVDKKEKQETQVKDELKKATQIQVKHEKAVEKSDFETQYQQSNYLPLGEAPKLLFSAGVKPNPEGRALLCMYPKDGQGVDVLLTDQIAHSFCKLITDACKKAKWDLDLTWSDIKPQSDSSEGNEQGLN